MIELPRNSVAPLSEVFWPRLPLRWLEFCDDAFSFDAKEFHMQMVYNSDSFAVVQFEVPASDAAAAVQPGDTASERLTRGGYEIVDKFARKEIFIEGALAQSFREGVDALIEAQPSEEEIDDYIERFSSLMQQPLLLH